MHLLLVTLLSACIIYLILFGPLCVVCFKEFAKRCAHAETDRKASRALYSSFRSLSLVLVGLGLVWSIFISCDHALITFHVCLGAT